MRRGLLLAAACAAALAGACKSKVPASLLLTVRNGAMASPPGEVRVRVFDAHGQAADVASFPTAAPGSDGLLGTVVIYPRPTSQALRIQAQGWVGLQQVSEGTVRVQLSDGRQSAAVVTL